MPLRYQIKGSSAKQVAASIEGAILSGSLAPGQKLPTVRELAARLRLSVATVASAYELLKIRGLLIANGRRGTAVSYQPPVRTRLEPPLPKDVRNLAAGAPDPELLPSLAEVVRRVKLHPRNYGEPYNRPELIEMAAQLLADGIPAAPVAVVGGAMDGIERVLQAMLRRGDRIAVEDPGYFMVLDLIRALGLIPLPLQIDEHGPLPDELERALDDGIEALVITPRAQNPTGAALDDARARDLRRLLRNRPDVLIIEDDHAGPTSGTAVFTLVDPGRPRWAVARSVSKWLGPDLRVAFLTGDELTIARVEGRQHLGTGWVSHLLQEIVLELLSDHRTGRLVRSAAHTYAARRDGLIEALRSRGIEAKGRSGFNVWIPVPEEVVVVRSLLEAGWAVAGGERFRMKSPPGIRVTASTLRIEEAARFASAFARCFEPQRLVRSA